MISYEEAVRRLLSVSFHPGSERVPLLHSRGRIIADAPKAPWPLPAFTNSAMDGFAVISADLSDAAASGPISLEIVGESAAGQGFEGTVQPGCTVRISTGAEVPDGADAVVPIERVIESGREVTFQEPVVAGGFIRARGSDTRAGTPLLEGGVRLDASCIALLAAFNLMEVEVMRRPRVGIISSGDEIKPLGSTLGAGEIIGTNSYYLEQELSAFGCETRVLGTACDQKDSLRTLLERALVWSDLVVSTAGVSVGPHDLVNSVVEDLGGEILFWRINIRPGKPTLAARFGRKILLGLPGNPVAVCCNTEVLLKPFLRKALGIRPVQSPLQSAVLTGDCPRDPKRLFFVHARLEASEEGVSVHPPTGFSSSKVANPALSNALIVLQPGEDKASKGETVSVLRTHPGS